MFTLSLAGALAFTVASAVVGFRLLRLAHRTRLAPELAMGVAFFASGAIGYPLIVIGTLIDGVAGAETWWFWVTSVGSTAVFAGYFSLTAGNWRIYRPTERWPRIGVGIFGLVFFACSVGLWLETERGRGTLRDVAFWSGMGTGVVAFTWAGIESTLLYGRLRRRASLGLADPEVANRVLLWSIGAGSSGALAAYNFAMRFLAPPDAAGDGQRLVTALLGLVAAVSIWLAFFPPAAYRRRFVRAAEAGAAPPTA